METQQNQHADLTYLKEIANGSKEFMIDMISTFIREIPKEIDKLEKYLAAKDWKSMKSVAHKMKSTFSIMGIKELEGDIKLINDYSGQEAHLDLLPALIAKSKQICAETVTELELFLKTQ